MTYEDTDYEVWENPGRGRVAIQKFDVRGMKKTEIVSGGRKFQVTPKERRMNQDLAASEDLDIFSNGVLRPLRMLEGTEDAKEIASNPNHISDSDMVELLKSHYKVLDDRLKTINNVGTLERLLELAQTEEVGATVRTVGKIRERLSLLDPARVEDTNNVVAAGDYAPSEGIKPVTPR